MYDNIAAIERISKMPKVPMTGCNSHKLHPKAQKMIELHPELSSATYSMYSSIRDAITRLKYPTILRYITDPGPIFDNGTQWSGIYYTLKRIGRLWNHKPAASPDYDCDINIDTSKRFSINHSKVLCHAEKIKLRSETFTIPWIHATTKLSRFRKPLWCNYWIKEEQTIAGIWLYARSRNIEFQERAANIPEFEYDVIKT